MFVNKKKFRQHFMKVKMISNLSALFGRPTFCYSINRIFYKQYIKKIYPCLMNIIDP